MSTPEFRERRRRYMAEYRKRQRGEPMPHEQVVALASAARSRKAEERRQEAERTQVAVDRENGRRAPGVGTNAERYEVKPAMTRADYMKAYYGEGKTANWSPHRKTKTVLA